MSASTHSPVLKHHFEDLHQQHASERLGMWMFLATEVLFFAGLFAAYTIYRMLYPAEFEFASSKLLWSIAAINTLLLVSSSFTMTMAIRSAQLGDKKALARRLLITAALGSGFMGLKAFEYATDFHEKLVPGELFQSELVSADLELNGMTAEQAAAYKFDDAKHEHWAQELAKHNFGKGPGDEGFISPERVQLFLMFYYVMTGIHGVHLVVGIGCVLWLVVETYRDKIPPENYSTVEMVSLYWHLVDAIWLFLMPLLYLAGAGMHH